MIYSTFGNSGIQVSQVGLGLGLGGSSARTASDQPLKEAIAAGLAAGVNHFDTAEIYGGGQSEEILGTFSREMLQGGLVATKVSPSNFSPERLASSIEGSLKRLRSEAIDLLYLHWPNPSIPLSETLHAVKDALTSGKIRSFGLSNFPISGIEEIMGLIGSEHVSAIQAEYNLFDRSAERDLLPFCRERGIAFVAYSPLDQGTLCGNTDHLAVLNSIASSAGCTAAQLALAWLVKKSSVFLMPASGSPSRVQENSLSAQVDVDDTVFDQIDVLTAFSPQLVVAKSVRVIPDPLGRREVYETLQDAISNPSGHSPSPLELSEDLLAGAVLKPVRLRQESGEEGELRYALTEGRIRFWAHVIAFGSGALVPALIRR